MRDKIIDGLNMEKINFYEEVKINSKDSNGCLGYIEENKEPLNNGGKMPL